MVHYLMEINALNDWELTHPLTATAYKVLCKLYYLANKERFPERMNVSNGVLMSMVGCTEKSLITARNQLVQSGRISYKGQKRMIPLYEIHYFTENNTNNCKNSSYNDSTNDSYKGGYKGGFAVGNTGGFPGGTYITKNKGEENRENNIYPQEMVRLAEQTAAKQGQGGNPAYIQGILRNFEQYGEPCVAAAKRQVQGADAGFQTHEYTEADFEDIYFDPARDMLGQLP